MTRISANDHAGILLYWDVDRGASLATVSMDWEDAAEVKADQTAVSGTTPDLNRLLEIARRSLRTCESKVYD
jgi:hypothetical protein